MQTANMRLKLDRGTCIPIEGVTPAEAMVLTIKDTKLPSHHNNCGTFPLYGITDIAEAKKLVLDDEKVWKTYDWVENPKSTEEEPLPKVKKFYTEPRTDKQELERLGRKYGKKTIAALWPGVSPSLPSTFEKVDGWEPADLEKIMASLGRKVEEPAKK